MLKYLCVLAGGGVGALFRYIMSVVVVARYSGRFPLATFVINVTGSFLIGVLMTLFNLRFAINPNWRLLLVTGVLGGYTTFSSFEYEVLGLEQQGAPWIAIGYIVSSVAAGYVAAWIGAFLVSRFTSLS